MLRCPASAPRRAARGCQQQLSQMRMRVGGRSSVGCVQPARAAHAAASGRHTLLPSGYGSLAARDL